MTTQQVAVDPSLLRPPAHDLLVAVGREMYPHPALGDGPYERVAGLVLSECATTPALALAVQVTLTAVAPDGSVPGPGPLLRSLEAIATTTAFEALRSRVCHHLYADREVWRHLGYPGSSFELGGYLHRGFDDLAWLPEPRVEESPEPLTEVATTTPAHDRTETEA